MKHEQVFVIEAREHPRHTLRGNVDECRCPRGGSVPEFGR